MPGLRGEAHGGKRQDQTDGPAFVEREGEPRGTQRTQSLFPAL